MAARRELKRKNTPKGSVERPKPHRTKEPDGVKRNAQNVILGLVYDGWFYPLDGMSDEDFKFVENHLMQERLSPGDTLKEEFAKVKDDPVLSEMLVDRAYRDMRKKKTVDKVTGDDVREFLNTREGATMSLWLMLRKHQPDLTVEDVTAIFNDCATADMHRRIDEANRDLIEGAGVKLDAEHPAAEVEVEVPTPPAAADGAG